MHLAISDPTGDSAIFEYIGGKLIIHHGKQYRVMTNSPRYDDQLALNEYWRGIGFTFLPGTNQAPDRFARASFLMDAIPKTIAPAYIKGVPGGTFGNQAVAGVLSVIRSVSVPLGIITPHKRNISATIWRSVADQTNKVYFFDSATSPDTFWVKLSDLNLKEGVGVKKLTMAGGRVYSGNTAASFEPAPMLHFLPAKAAE